MKYNKLICYVGSDIEYGNSAITILMSKKKEIKAIVGYTAKKIYSDLALVLKKNKDILLFNKKTVWDDKDYHNLFDGSTLGVNCGFDYIFPQSILSKHNVVNLHPAALPLNRGCHHSFWGIMEKTIFGATIHWMDKGIDTGPIINQKVFEDDGIMTAAEIQAKSNFMCLELLSENINEIMDGTVKSSPQNNGTYHSKKQIINGSTINYYEKIDVKYLYDLCRATCNKENGFIILKDGVKYLIRIKEIEKLI